MRTNVWLTIVVACALGAGVLAFLLATPDQSGRVQPAAMGFRALSVEAVERGVGNAAAFHRAADAHRISIRGARIAADAWIAGLPTRSVGAQPLHAAARRRVQSFVRWADGIPGASWAAHIGSVAPIDDASAGSYTATAMLDVTVAQASTRLRHQTLRLALELRSAPAVHRGSPARWRVVDVRVTSPATYLRAYADPMVVHRSAVDVVASTAARMTALDVSAQAQSILPGLRRRYASLDGAGTATIWILDADASSPKVLGGAAVPDAAAWTETNGDVAIQLAAWSRLDPAARRTTLRHELARVATLGLGRRAPALYVDGIASAEAYRFDDTGPAAYARLASLATAFGHGDSGLRALLLAPASRVLDDPAAPVRSRLRHDAARATVQWIEDVRGHDALVQLLIQLEDGVAPARALTDVLHLDARGVEVAVARWTRARVVAAEPSSGR